MQPKVEVFSDSQKTFIKRERIRQALLRAKPGEAVCLQAPDVVLMLEWLDELERKAGASHVRKSY